MIQIVSRNAWGAAPPVRIAPFNVPARERRGLTIHWNGPALKLNTALPHDELVAREKSKLRAIQRYQQSTRGWSDFAYSYAAGQSGVIYEGRGSLWNQFANGEDKVGRNDGPDRVWYTVLWLGGEGEAPTLAALASISGLVQHLRNLGAGMQVLPHSDFKVKPCPGPHLTLLARTLHNQPIPQEADDMTDQERALLVEVAQRVRAMHAGSYGENPGYPLGDLAWLDRRLAKSAAEITRAVVAEVGRASGVTIDANKVADLVVKRIGESLAGK